MAYFPTYLDMTELKVLVVGAGNIATDKIEKLVDFTENITVLASCVDDKAQTLIDKHGLTLKMKEYKVGDIEGFDMVIIATPEALQKSIYKESRKLKILVNSVDNKEYCDFIFPSYIQKGDLSIAFSTAGASPAFSKHMRLHIDSILPDSVVEFLNKMKNARKLLPKGKERMEYFDKEVTTYFSKYFK